MDPLGQAQELLPKRLCPLVLAVGAIKSPETPQHREELWGLSHLLTQLPRSGIGLFYFGSRNALGGHQRWTEGSLQHEFSLGALGSVRQRLEQLQPLAH